MSETAPKWVDLFGIDPDYVKDAVHLDVDPWDRPAAPATQPMTLAEYDRLRDDVRAAVIHDKAFAPEAFWFLFTSLGTLAQTSADPDGFAARVLERVALRAKDGIPMWAGEDEL